MILILAASSISLLISLVGTPIAIRIFRRRGYGQEIREDGPTTHLTKRGTPTMGGTVIVIAVILGYSLAHLLRMSPPTWTGVSLLLLMLGMGAVGFLDDYIKVYKQRSLGLRTKAKLAGQGVVAVAFAVLVLQFPDQRGLTPASTAISFLRDTGLVLGPVLFVVWVYLLLASTTNAVNVTDGLDGLATGATILVAASYVLIGIWQFSQRCSAMPGPRCYDVRDPIDLAVVAAAVVGASIGFLWWNTSPAQIFMGDTGSLALGGVLAGLAIVSRTELLLAILGGLFAIITLSILIQVAWFKATGGKRLFRMAPLHHHFELKGWAEITIVVRFWIIAGLFVAAGLGIFYAEWVTGV